MRELLKIKQEKCEKRDNGYKHRLLCEKEKRWRKKIENKNSFYLKWTRRILVVLFKNYTEIKLMVPFIIAENFNV